VWSTLDTLLVRVDTDQGLTGWGEAFGYNVNEATKVVLDGFIGPLAVGRDATDIAGLNHDLQRKTHNFGRNGSVIYAISGLDIALWDIAGKAAGLPLYRLLGGAARAQVPAYASLMRYADDALLRKITTEAVGRGYRYVKLHEVTPSAVGAAREAAGADIALTMDANCPWTVREAKEIAREVQPYNLYWLEEPVWPPENYAGLAEVGRASGIPIAAGENAGSAMDFHHMFSAGAVTFAQPSVTKIGGITELRKIMTLADAHNITVVPHAPYFGPGLLATLHLLAAYPPASLFERLYVDLEASLFGDATDPRGGEMRVPQGQGLGHDPDPAVVARYRTT
jgi:D-galactarolactone cycloisomerase